jgi:hypothetical protein
MAKVAEQLTFLIAILASFNAVPLEWRKQDKRGRKDNSVKRKCASEKN